MFAMFVFLTLDMLLVICPETIGLWPASLQKKNPNRNAFVNFVIFFRKFFLHDLWMTASVLLSTEI